MAKFDISKNISLSLESEKANSGNKYYTRFFYPTG